MSWSEGRFYSIGFGRCFENGDFLFVIVEDATTNVFWAIVWAWEGGIVNADKLDAWIYGLRQDWIIGNIDRCRKFRSNRKWLSIPRGRSWLCILRSTKSSKCNFPYLFD